MKLNKKLILTTIIAISVFVSSTSYASEKDKVSISINENALSKMAKKVDKNTIFAEEGTDLPKKEENNMTQDNKPKDDKKPENQESSENPNVIVKPQTEKDEKPNNLEGQDESEIPKNDTNDKDDLEANKNSDELDGENKPNKGKVDKTEKPKNPNSSSHKDNFDKVPIQGEENNPEFNKFESMHRLENMQRNEKKQNNAYIGGFDSNTATLQKLTSKETLTTSFKDKGSNLRLNLANINDDEDSTGKKESQFIVKPQTIIILIAILAAIFSAISIAIRVNKKNKSQ